MNKNTGKNIFFLLFTVTLFILIFSGCSAGSNQSGNIISFTSYRDIPGVTSEEIAAIEAIRQQRDFFVYGMLPSTDAFMNADGEIRGYSALFCEWLSALFGIPFITEHFTWSGMLDGLENGGLDFTGDLTANENRRRTYFMTDTMAQRSIKYYRLEDSRPLAEIAINRLPRYILQEKTTIALDVENYAGGRFEPVYIMDYDEVYDLLKTGLADALITEGVQEAYFDQYGDVITEDFYPLIYSPVSLSTQNPQLEPFISVIQKALDAGAIRYLNELYDQGYQEYLVHKLYLKLTDEEKEYIKNNPVVHLAAEFDNYPVSFFSEHYREWQGICFDVIERLEVLTGLEFVIHNDNKSEFNELIRMLEAGEVHMISELIPTPEREGFYLWPNNVFMTERSVLISRIDFPNININRVYSVRVGLSRGTAHSEFFFQWFPNHPYAVEFDSQADSFEALKKGEIDMVMNSYSTLLHLTNYQELPDFKANVMFDDSYNSTFGFNVDQAVLCSIIDKALELTDTKTISEQWRHRTYDYRLKLAQARVPWLIGSIILVICILVLVGILYRRTIIAGKLQEELVQKRTYELALQTATLTTLFDSIPDLIFTRNLKLKYLHCNKAFLEHFSRTIDDIVGNTSEECLDITPEEANAFNEMDQKVITERQTLSVEEYIPRFDGTKPFYETIKMPLILDGDVIGILGIARDITKRKEMENAALAASQSKSTFLANMSHEIRTPMNAILGVTEILIQNETLPVDIIEGLNKIHSSCELLLGIINDILDFSKIEAGKLDIMPAQYKVASMINDAVHLNMMRIDSKPIEFELQVDENIPAKLIGDELRIKQILNNLLSNAFKYTDAGKVTLAVNSVCENDKVTLALGVRDTGHGMTHEQLAKMFDEYSRFNPDKHITVEGTGLGLAITKRILNLMNGEMHVESEPGAGSLFVVKIPQTRVDDVVLGKEVTENLQQFRMNYITQRKRGQVTRDLMPYGRVLVVDDVETNLYVAVGLMKLYKLKVDTSMSGQEAINRVKDGNVYDVIFMDHMMPEMDGIETTGHLRNLGYKEPIVALTANAVAGQADMFLQSGFDDFISKPIDIRRLDSVLNKLVRDKQPPEVLEEAKKKKAEINGNGAQHPGTNSMLLESFIRDARKAVTWLKEQFHNGDFGSEEVLQRYTVIVHGIKSSLWNIGEKALSETAHSLEVAGRDRDVSNIKSSTPGFLNDLNGLLERVESEQKENVSNEVIEDLHDKLLSLQELCADYNRKGALELLAGLKNSSNMSREVLEKITEYVLHSEFENAENATVEYDVALAVGSSPVGLRILNSKIEGLDIPKGLQRYECDEHLYLRVLRSYAASVRSMLTGTESVSEEKLNDYKIKVHGIKGTSFDIFAMQVGNAAKELEDAAKAGNYSYIMESNPAFLESAWKLIADIENIISAIDAENPKPEKLRPDDKVLQKLLAACRDYDMDGADAAMEELEKFKYTGDDGLTVLLRECIDKMDFSQIVKKLSDSAK